MARKMMNEKLWWAIKCLLKGDASTDEAAAYFGVSANTVRMVRNSETFEEYKQMSAAMHAKYRTPKKLKAEDKPVQVEDKPAQVVEHRQTITVQATHYMMQEMQKTNELLTAISNKLAFIVDELTK